MKRLIIVVLTVFLFANSYAQWISAGEMEGGNIKALTISGNMSFVLTDEGLFSSDNQGQKWNSVFIDEKLQSSEIALVSALGKNVFLGTKRGMYVSVDNGDKWTLFNNGMPRNSTVLCVNAIGDKLICATSESMYITGNSAPKWEKRKGDPEKNGELPSNIFIKDMVVKGNDIYIATFGRGVYRTSDYGETWQELNEGLTESKNKKVLSIAFVGSTLLAGTNRNGVWVSRNYGLSWEEANEGLPPKVNANKLLTVGGVVYVGTNEGVYISRSGGSSWSKCEGGFPEGVSSEALATNGSYVMTGTEGAGVLITTNSGGSWNYVNSGLKLTVAVNCIAQDNIQFLVGTDGSGVFSSTNEGASWVPLNMGLPPKLKVKEIVVRDSLTLLATDNFIYISANSGKTWTSSRTGLKDKVVNDIDFLGKKIYACTNNGVFESGDNGKRWNSISIGLLNSHVFCMNILIGKKDTLFFCGTQSGMYVSSDKGAKWKIVNSNMLGVEFYTIKNIGTFMLSSTDKWGAIKSAKKGKKWFPIVTGLDYKTVPRNYLLSGKKSIIMASSSGVYMSNNKGKEWKKFNMGLSNTNVYGLTINETNIYCGNQIGNVYFYPVFKK